MNSNDIINIKITLSCFQKNLNKEIIIKKNPVEGTMYLLQLIELFNKIELEYN